MPGSRIRDYFFGGPHTNREGLVFNGAFWLTLAVVWTLTVIVINIWVGW